MRAEPSRRAAVHFLVGPERIERRSVEIPAPGPREVVLRVQAALTCGTDLKVFRAGGHARMLRPPCPFGHEVAGAIAETGAAVDDFQVGDEVVVANSSPCRRCRACRAGRENLCEDLRYLNGAFGEYLTIPERFVRTSLHRRPNGLAPEVAAAAEPLACVLHGLERLTSLAAGIAREDVLVLGAGSIGLLFVAALRAHEAADRITVVDPHPKRLEIATRMGASRTVLGRAEPGVLEESGGPFDALVDASGLRRPTAEIGERLRPGAAVLFFAGQPPGTTVDTDLHGLHYRELALLGAYHFTPRHYRDALVHLASGSIDPRPLLTSRRPMAELVEALRSMARREDVKVVLRP